MSRRLLLQSILKFREGIKSGTAKVQDIVEDYFKSSGKSVTDEDRAIIMNEFAESAPSNVEEVFFGSGDPRFYKPKSETPFTDLVEQERGVKLTGKESFGELMEKLGPAGSKKEGISSLFFRDLDPQILSVGHLIDLPQFDSSFGRLDSFSSVTTSNGVFLDSCTILQDIASKSQSARGGLTI